MRHKAAVTLEARREEEVMGEGRVIGCGQKVKVSRKRKRAQGEKR